MFQLLHYNNENGVTDIGYFKTLKDAHTVIYKSLNDGEEEKLIFPNFPDDVILNGGSYYIFDENSKEEAGVCYFKTVLIWDDLDTAFYIIDLPPILNLDNEKVEVYADTIRTVISFLRENEEYGDDWSEEIKNLDSLLDEIK